MWRERDLNSRPPGVTPAIPKALEHVGGNCESGYTRLSFQRVTHIDVVHYSVSTIVVLFESPLLIKLEENNAHLDTAFNICASFVLRV